MQVIDHGLDPLASPLALAPAEIHHAGSDMKQAMASSGRGGLFVTIRYACRKTFERQKRQLTVNSAAILEGRQPPQAAGMPHQVEEPRL